MKHIDKLTLKKLNVLKENFKKLTKIEASTNMFLLPSDALIIALENLRKKIYFLEKKLEVKN